MDLTPEALLAAYAQGIFPMATEDGRISWYSPDPRAVLPIERLHVSRSLRRVIRRGTYEIKINSAFEEVITRCAPPSAGRESTWISQDIVAAYTWLHELGFAHSVEAWNDGHLVGGLYGVSLRGLFAGESMFSLMPDASKVALHTLVMRLKERGYLLLDVQFLTPHLESLGAVEVPRWQYYELLREAMAIQARFV
jgi:leucyl/phenylalanyl-tRNA--protein transferase